MYIDYQSKNIALFKHRTLGLPNGRKIEASIPSSILETPKLMKCCIREILATDGVLGFYSAAEKAAHKYPRIQITMTAEKVIGQIANFLRQQIGINASCRFGAEPGTSEWRPRHRIQINRSANIEKWRKEIGFSNPSHISRLMTFEILGECPPRTNLLDRLSYLTGCSNGIRTSGPLPRWTFESVISQMRREYGYPELHGHEIIEAIHRINMRLKHLARELPRIVE
jgi:hypothetical protein